MNKYQITPSKEITIDFPGDTIRIKPKHPDTEIKIHCSRCVRYETLLEFIKHISKFGVFSLSSHWHLHRQAKELLQELGEIE